VKRLSGRRAGAYWRLLVHGVPEVGQRMFGPAHNVYSHERDVKQHQKTGEWLGDYPTKDEETVTFLPGTEFDELVVGHWIHIEGMDTGYWWMNIGGVTVHVTADRDGHPKRVRVDMPGFYDEPVDGCAYLLNDEEFEPPPRPDWSQLMAKHRKEEGS
jgi:hypothetical protein